MPPVILLRTTPGARFVDWLETAKPTPKPVTPPLDEKYRNGFHAISCIVAAVALVIALITVR